MYRRVVGAGNSAERLHRFCERCESLWEFVYAQCEGRGEEYEMGGRRGYAYGRDRLGVLVAVQFARQSQRSTSTHPRKPAYLRPRLHVRQYRLLADARYEPRSIRSDCDRAAGVQRRDDPGLFKPICAAKPVSMRRRGRGKAYLRGFELWPRRRCHDRKSAGHKRPC